MAKIVHDLVVNNTRYDLGTVHYIVGTGTTAGTWLGSDSSIQEYYDGLTIAYKLNIAGASTTTLNINGLGAKTVYLGGTTKLTTQYPVNSVVLLTYTITNSTGCWQCADSHHTPSCTTSTKSSGATGGTANLKLATGNGIGDMYAPLATASTPGVTIVYPADSCTTFSSDSGAVTPLAVQKAAKMFGIPRPTSVKNTVPRFINTTGELESTGIKIESVTNTKDSSKTAYVLSIPAEGGKKMVYGYCTDQTDGTSFIGGVFDASATTFPYASGLAIGGTSGNLLWKGKQVATTDMIPSGAKEVTVSVPTTGWKTDSTYGNKVTITVSGVTANSNPIADVVLNGSTLAANKTLLEQWSYISKITTAANSVTLYAFDTVPTTAFSILMKFV